MSSLRDSWKTFALQWRLYLHFLWPSIVVGSLGGGILITAALFLYNTFVFPVHALQLSGFTILEAWEALSLSSLQLFLTGVAVLVAMVAILLWKASHYIQIRYCLEHAELPYSTAFARPFRLSLFRTFLRYVLIDGLLIIFFSIPISFVIVGAYLWGWWLLLLLLPTLMFATIIGKAIKLHFVVEGLSLPATVHRAITADVRRFGKIFLVWLLSGIPFSLVLLAALLPVAALFLAGTTNTYGMWLGDPNGLPPYFSVLLFAVTMLAAAIYMLATGIRNWCLALKILSTSTKLEN